MQLSLDKLTTQLLGPQACGQPEFPGMNSIFWADQGEMCSNVPDVTAPILKNSITQDHSLDV